jgi:hypothetical protein
MKPEIEYQVQVRWDGLWWAVAHGTSVESAKAKAKGNADYESGRPRRVVRVTRTTTVEVVEGDPIAEVSR